MTLRAWSLRFFDDPERAGSRRYGSMERELLEGKPIETVL
jgi:hypothetical protein